MTTEEKIVKAKARLILSNPFFAVLSLRMQFVASDVETCETDGKTIEYNPAYVDGMDIDRLTAVIAHEVLHTVMFHHTRRGDRDLKIWNEAADYAINPLLKAAGFDLPESALIDDDYAHMTAEQIFSLIPTKQPPPQQQPQNGPQPPPTTGGGMGGIKDPPPQANKEQLETEIKIAFTQAAMLADKAGKMPADIQLFIDQELQPKVDWRQVLARFVTELTKNDYTWTIPSPRYMHLGLFLPSLRSPEMGRLIIIVDTSGSIDEEMINQFGGEVQDITSMYNIDLTVIYVDAKVKGVQEIERGDRIELKPIGGGGTSFRPGFAYIEENDMRPKAVVYLTDGDCSAFPGQPDYPVLWALFGYRKEFNPPFGEAVYVD